jgi:hypothetical protein
MRTVEERRDQFIQALVAGVDEQRKEDRLRGQIGELQWMMQIDMVGKNLLTEEEKKNGK